MPSHTSTNQSDPPSVPARAAEVRDLMARAQAGDAEAFGDIYRCYAKQITAFIFLRTRDRRLTEDLTSETFLRALRGIEGFTWQGREPVAWLMTIARNLIFDHRKSAQRRLETITSDVGDYDRRDSYDWEDPERVALSRLTVAAMLKEVMRLPEDQRRCLVLRFVRDLSVPEVARLMGRSEVGIRSLQYRAVRAVRERVFWTPPL